MAIEVLVASQSEIKIQAVEAAFQAVFVDREVHVRGIEDADSYVNAQPVGKQTKRGAKNRLKNAKAALLQERRIAKTAGFSVPPVPDYYVSIENGLFPEGKGEAVRYFDRAVVIIQQQGGRRRFATSEKVEFPIEFVKEAQEKGFQTTTVGSVIARKQGGDKQDPHATLTEGKVRRATLLTDTTLAALRRFQ